uniref:Uncharacterized protein n=1 Tax=viral metagenome TaxID=1070528 RepID=A0A6C0D4N1_9ZZZZ
MELMNRFPQFELSYETISHKKVPEQYDICMAIPTGKKVFIWFTFHQKEDVCYMLDMNKEKRVYQSTKIDIVFDADLSLGTILYGTIVLDEETSVRRFIAEDVFFYKGIQLRKSMMSEKLYFLLQFMSCVSSQYDNHNNLLFYLPVIWKKDNMTTDFGRLPNDVKLSIGYPVHHIQYRSTNETAPFLNFLLSSNINLKQTEKPVYNKPLPEFVQYYPMRCDYSKPQYKIPTIFQVSADIQFDIYHLFSFGKNKAPVYYNIAHIPNYDTSVFMNGLFRNIRENRNLDYIEESDDEDEFQNTSLDKYVDTNKTMLVECIFSHKFKKWIPVKAMGRHNKVVHISQL